MQPLTRDGVGFLGDFTGDGVPDLLVARWNDEALFCRNTGTAASPRFADVRPAVAGSTSLSTAHRGDTESG